MKIEAIDVFVTCPAGTNYVVVKVQTDQDGLYGYGSGKFLGGEHALAALIEHTLAPRLIGADPDRIEDIWQLLRRSMFWRTGPVLKAAMAAIDVALWDIKGRRASLPVYSLLGGRTRERVLCYGHASGDSMSTARLMRQLTSTPLAIGERIFSMWDCLPLLSGQLVDFIRVGLGMCGGITELRKIATVAEAFGVRTAFQGPTDCGPCAFSAMVHLDLAIANFGIQERADFPDCVHEVFGGLPTFRDGYLEVTDAPGLGVEFDARAAARYPHRQAWEPLVRREDGALVEP